MGSKQKKQTPRDFVGSVKHALDVLRAFDGDHFQMTLSEVSERTGLTRAGARRYLLTLEHLAYIRKDERLFSLTPKVLDLGFSFLSTVDLSEIARPYLREITQDTGEIAGLAVLDSRDIVYVAKSTVERTLAPTLTIGRRYNALYTSPGRAIAAFLDQGTAEEIFKHSEIVALTPFSMTSEAAIREELAQVRRQGYAISDQELEVGVRSISVPIFNRKRVPVGAVSVLTNVATVSKKRLLEEILPVVARVAAEIPAQAL
jgi:IclR family transcriptional regulator, pca regulon regulatory protein